MRTKRIELMCLEGSGDCFIEIGYGDNGDFYVKMVGQDTRGETVIAQGQIPNPTNGGGDLEKYKKLKEIYDLLQTK